MSEQRPTNSAGGRRLDQVAASALVRSRPWDVVGTAIGVPMMLWGFLGWFGTVGDTGGGVPGFFSGTGAAGIGLVLAATALSLNQMLSGRAHNATAPPVSVLLAAAAAIVILGGMIAKPASTTIEAGSVAGLLTAISQGAILTVGWVTGSGKAVKAAHVQAWNARQMAADQAAAASGRSSVPPYGSLGTPAPGTYPIPGQYPYPPPPGLSGQPDAPQPPYPPIWQAPGQHPYGPR
jgi:hypothetical protein